MLAALVAVGCLAIAVLAARWLIGLPAVASFVERYPGTGAVPAAAPTGLPAWAGWQHFLNLFFMVLIIRTGWQVRTTRRPEAYWTRNNKRFPRTKGAPTKISLDLWLHLSLDALWLLNGAVFVVLLFATGQWLRIVPTTWEVLPNAASVGLQYLSLDWPTENGWIHYNALQSLTYFVTIFVAAPLAAITGFRMSSAWSKRWTRAGKVFPVDLARKLHLPVMVYFVLFIVTHVTLVMATGALRNLNHIFAARDDAGWTGFGFFAGALAVVVVGWVLARPMFLQPVASLTGKVTAR
nr:cytochrome b/b6 domain-containing protein [Georgenia sp. SYP-B2076]